MSYNLLRDFILPVTSTSRQTAAKSGFPLQEVPVAQRQRHHAGKRRSRHPRGLQLHLSGRPTDTFDQVALTNSNSTMVYLLLVHCLSTCYSKNTSAIDTVMTVIHRRESVMRRQGRWPRCPRDCARQTP